jgi:hypothetical protein
MSPLMMALLGLLAYKAVKGMGGDRPAPSAPTTGGGGLGCAALKEFFLFVGRAKAKEFLINLHCVPIGQPARSIHADI